MTPCPILHMTLPDGSTGRLGLASELDPDLLGTLADEGWAVSHPEARRVCRDGFGMPPEEVTPLLAVSPDPLPVVDFLVWLGY